jgi:predicted nucleic acid-binding Zn ribbon protein
MDKDKQDTSVTPLKGILTTVLRQCRRDLQLDPDFLMPIWNRAAGAVIARNAQPAAFKQRLLIVHVSSSVWLQELYFQKAALIKRINLEAGQIILDDIHFKVGPLVAP